MGIQSMEPGAMDSQDRNAISREMLEHFLGPFDDRLNARGNTTITWEDLPMLDPAHLLGGQPQSPSLYPDGADHSHLFAFLDTIENGNEEVRLASTRP